VNKEKKIPEITGLSVGSTTTILILGFLVLRYLPTPLTVPPDPDPATKMSILPAVSFHISGPDSLHHFKVTCYKLSTTTTPLIPN
jgi:hypothetical protein